MDKRLFNDLVQSLKEAQGIVRREAPASCGLEDLEDLYLADSIMERVRQGKETVHSAESVEAKLGLGR